MDDATIVNLLQRVLDNIVHNQKIKNAENDDHYNKIIELYPLCDRPKIRLIPNVYKNHIHGLFFALEVLKQHGENIRINKDVMKSLNQSLLSHSLISSRRSTKNAIRIRTIELEFSTEQTPQPAQLTEDDFQLLQHLRSK